MKQRKSEAQRRQRMAEMDEALLSMDRAKILAFHKKHNGKDGEEVDEAVFWIGIHKARTASRRLPESERRKSMAWLTERGFQHFASDLVERGMF